MSLPVAIAMLLFAFFIRILPRLLRPFKTDSDTWYHISSVSSIVKNNYKIPTCNYGFLLGGKYDYPYFAHWISAVILKDSIIKYEKFIGPFVDVIYILTGYVYLIYLLHHYAIPNTLNIEILYFLLTTFSVTMLKISTGPRVYNFTPRIFGELFIFIFFVCLHLYFLEENILFLFIAILFSAFALNTSTFGSQVLLFTSTILSLLLVSVIPIISVLASGLLALIISKGHYKKILFQQLKYSYQYAKYGQFSHPAVQNRNKLTQYFKFLNKLFSFEFKKAYSIFQSDLPFINIIYKNLDVVVGIFLILYFNFIDQFIYSIFASLVAIFIFTSFKPFLFLGESDRYLDYLVMFSIIVISLTLESSYVFYFIGFEVIMYIIILSLYLKSSDSYGINFLNAMKFIKENLNDKNNSVIHGIFGSYIHYPLSVLTGLKSLAIEANYVFDLTSDKKLMPKDTLYTNDFDYLYDKYGVNIIVANRKYLHQELKYNFDKFDNIFENDEYIVYVRKSANDSI